jgi:hypothetical protein
MVVIHNRLCDERDITTMGHGVYKRICESVIHRKRVYSFTREKRTLDTHRCADQKNVSTEWELIRWNVRIL